MIDTNLKLFISGIILMSLGLAYSLIFKRVDIFFVSPFVSGLFAFAYSLHAMFWNSIRIIFEAEEPYPDFYRHKECRGKEHDGQIIPYWNEEQGFWHPFCLGWCEDCRKAVSRIEVETVEGEPFVK